MARLPAPIDLSGRSRIKALLGPTNTGKTHRALERMLSHRSGMIGLPLRLLAREVYDRLCARVGAESVALITGEERIVPDGARYFSCTVEAMPLSLGVAFLAVDEIQLAAHRERGHVFTDRLLNARGFSETWFLGSDTMVSLIQQLVPTAEIETYPRLSQLKYTGPQRLSSLPPRSAIVAFSAENVYEIAERVRGRHGGAAVVFGALSPRARNAQVEMYQAGEVRYLVATDAIGMGLNLDIHHLVFGALHKFDGHERRRLEPGEMGQVAGRAGRFRRDGTFGVTAYCAAEQGGLTEGEIEAVQQQRFHEVRRIYYRNSSLEFDSPAALLDSLAARPPARCMNPMLTAIDHESLAATLRDPAVSQKVTSPERLELLWEVCRVPDFRRVSPEQHVALLKQLFGQLVEGGQLREPWVESRLARLDRAEGDVEELMTRIAFVRTWTYVANRPGWLADSGRWREHTRAIEDRLSDALHERLTQRFVDQRAVVLLSELASGAEISAELTPEGEVRAAGVTLGRLEGLDFAAVEEGSEVGLRAIRRAARRALEGELARRVAALEGAPQSALAVDSEGALRWEGAVVAWLEAGDAPLAPRARLPAFPLLSAPQRETVRRRVEAWVQQEAAALLEPLRRAEERLRPGAGRGLLYRLQQGLGALPKAEAAQQVGELADGERKALHAAGVRLGVHAVYALPLLKPAALQRRAWLWGIHRGVRPLLAAPSGAPSVPADADAAFYAATGYRKLGPRAVRIDLVERLDALLREQTRGGEAPLPFEACTWLGCSRDALAAVVGALGYEVEGEKVRRAKRREHDRRQHQRRRG